MPTNPELNGTPAEAQALVTPKMLAAAWDAWRARHRGNLGPGPAFSEALAAGLAVYLAEKPALRAAASDQGSAGQGAREAAIDMRERAARAAATAVLITDNTAVSLAQERALDRAVVAIRALSLPALGAGETEGRTDGL